MKSVQMGRIAYRTALVLLAVAFVVEQPGRGDEDKLPAKKPSGRGGHRLPAHYGSVVNEKQRQEIYKIQDEYQPKIEALEDQLKALKKQRDEKIFAVLTDEQKKLVAEATSKGKRKSKNAQPVKPGPQAPVPAPAEPKPPK